MSRFVWNWMRDYQNPPKWLRLQNAAALIQKGSSITHPLTKTTVQQRSDKCPHARWLQLEEIGIPCLDAPTEHYDGCCDARRSVVASEHFYLLHVFSSQHQRLKGEAA